MSLIFQVSNNIESHYMLENFHKLLFIFGQHNRNLSKMKSYLLNMKVDNIETQWWWIMVIYLRLSNFPHTSNNFLSQERQKPHTPMNEIIAHSTPSMENRANCGTNDQIRALYERKPLKHLLYIWFDIMRMWVMNKHREVFGPFGWYHTSATSIEYSLLNFHSYESMIVSKNVKYP